MLMPKKVKYRKQQRGTHDGQGLARVRGLVRRLRAEGAGAGWVTGAPDRGGRIAMTRFIKRGGKIWIRMFPDKPITKKPQETRMGKGKGAPEAWVCVIKPGRILFEMEGVDEVTAKRAMGLAAAKLPIQTKFAMRFAAQQEQA